MCINSFPGGSDSKESACNAGDQGSIPASGRCPGEGNGNPLQYPCLENLMNRGAWQATVCGVTRVRHDLVTKPQPLRQNELSWNFSVLILTAHSSMWVNLWIKLG